MHVQSQTITQVNSEIPAAETSVDRLVNRRIALLEEQLEESCDVETKLVADVEKNTQSITELEKLVADHVETNTQRITELERLVAKTIGEKLEIFEQSEKAAKRIAELEKRVAAVEEECQDWWPPNPASTVEGECQDWWRPYPASGWAPPSSSK